MNLTIREVCQEFNFTFRAVRVYEEKGLVAPERKGRRRVYHTDDVERLRKIVTLK